MALENTLQLELIFCFFFLSNQLFYQLKMLRGPLFSNNTFNFIFLFPASSINAPETTLVWVQAWNLKKKNEAEPFCSCISCSFYFPAFLSDELLITIICFSAISRCGLSFMRVSRRMLKLSCSCFLLWPHFLVIYCS